MDNARKVLGDFEGKVRYCKSLAEATEGADAVAIVTEWNEFITQDWGKVAKMMRGTARGLRAVRKSVDGIALSQVRTVALDPRSRGAG